MENTRSNAQAKLENIYANARPRIKTSDDGYAVYSGDDRLGGVTQNTNDYGSYKGAYVDNVVDPAKGAYDGSVNLPLGLGTLDYGYDDGTAYAGIRNPYVTGTYSNANGAGAYLDRDGQNVAEAYRQDWGNGNTAYGGAINTGLNIPDSYNEINLPFGGGMIGYGSQNGRIQADYTPEQNSIMARLLQAITRR